jgi:hypothetical protein
VVGCYGSDVRISRQNGAARGRAIHKAVGEGCGDGLPADGVAFLAELDQAAVGVEVMKLEGEGASARGLGMKPE